MGLRCYINDPHTDQISIQQSNNPWYPSTKLSSLFLRGVKEINMCLFLPCVCGFFLFLFCLKSRLCCLIPFASYKKSGSKRRLFYRVSTYSAQTYPIHKQHNVYSVWQTLHGSDIKACISYFCVCICGFFLMWMYMCICGWKCWILTVSLHLNRGKQEKKSTMYIEQKTNLTFFKTKAWLYINNRCAFKSYK